MKLEEVLPALRNGKKIIRIDTFPDGAYIYILGDEFQLCVDNTRNPTDKFKLDVDDINSNKWVIVE